MLCIKIKYTPARHTHIDLDFRILHWVRTLTIYSWGSLYWAYSVNFIFGFKKQTKKTQGTLEYIHSTRNLTLFSLSHTTKELESSLLSAFPLLACVSWFVWFTASKHIVYVTHVIVIKHRVIWKHRVTWFLFAPLSSVLVSESSPCDKALWLLSSVLAM